MINHYQSFAKDKPKFYVIGINPSKSAIMNIFPLWMKVLERPEVIIESVDLLNNDSPEYYNFVIDQIKKDPLSLGAMVTTNKISLYNATRDKFDYLDPDALSRGEVASITKNEGKLVGHDIDQMSAGLSLEEILEPGYFERTSGEVLCFGVGGSGMAIALHLINKNNKADRPRRYIFSNRSQWRLNQAKEMVDKENTDILFEYISNNDMEINDHLMETMPSYSIVINATGMGKDIPGSPISWSSRFPHNGIAWDVNYRGSLDFLHQAEAQIKSRKLKVEDGWQYFLHGWTQVIAKALNITLTPELFRELAIVAETMRKKLL
jgi:shikimate 5-dehydrogenase